MTCRNKWVNGVIPALLIHLSIGTVYAWSVFTKPITEHIGCTLPQTQFAFSLAIFFLGMSSACFGRLVEKNVAKSAMISAILFGSGLLVTSFAITLKSLALLYIGYGVLVGIGLGIGYITPVKTLVLWFGKNKGFATGLAIMGFGFASAIYSPIFSKLLTTLGLSNTFTIIGILFYMLIMASSFLIKKPFEDTEVIVKVPLKALVQHRTFRLIWLIVFLNILCGLIIIGNASPLLQQSGLTIAQASVFVGVIGIFNGAGRIVVATISDRLGNRKWVYEYIALIAIISVCALYILSVSSIIMGCIFAIIAILYGANFSCLPALLSDIYGTKSLSYIHGVSLSAWGIAGLVSVVFSKIIYTHHGFGILLTLYSISFYLTTRLKINYGKSKEVIEYIL